MSNLHLVYEDWRYITRYEGLYIVSNRGRVKRMSSVVPHSFSGYLTISERLMTISKDKHGYSKVILSKFGKHWVVKVHLLVWEAFGTTKRQGRVMVVDHIDNIKEHNEIFNLQCISHWLNSTKDRKRKHSKYLGVSKHSNKKKCWQASMTVKGKKKRLGLFYTEEEASEAYQKELQSIKKNVA